MQKFDRLPVGRAHECHHAVARWPVDGDAPIHQAVACRIDVVYLEREVAEIAGFAVILGVLIVGELEQILRTPLSLVLSQASISQAATPPA